MRIRNVIALSLVLLAFGHCVHAADGEAAKLDSAAVDFFEKKIRPVLVEKCYECHSEQAKPTANSKAGCCWTVARPLWPVVIPVRRLFRES